MKKAEIKKMELYLYYDLSHRLIYHMCFWKVYYASGAVKKVAGIDNRALNDNQENWYERAVQVSERNDFYGESAYIKIRTYYKRA